MSNTYFDELANEILAHMEVADASFSIPVGVSNRHVHLSKLDLERLFGPGYAMTPMKDLSQPGQFAAKETVTLAGPKGAIQNVRVLGPTRFESQVEVSRTDSYALGIHPPVRLSGDLASSTSLCLIGPAGMLMLEQGVIIAKRHVHMTPRDAGHYGVIDGDLVYIRNLGDRRCLFYDTAVRVTDNSALEFHIDTDEANAAGISTGMLVQIISKHRR